MGFVAGAGLGSRRRPSIGWLPIGVLRPGPAAKALPVVAFCVASGHAASGPSTPGWEYRLWGDEDKEKAHVFANMGPLDGTPNGSRTRVSAVRGRHPWPLDDGSLIKISKWMGY